MTVMLEHPLWSEDCVIRDPWLEEAPRYAEPGTIALHWYGGEGKHILVLSGNDADDFMEQYRATETFADRHLLMRDEIAKAVSA
jgi:hypothetical protein